MDWHNCGYCYRTSAVPLLPPFFWISCRHLVHRSPIGPGHNDPRICRTVPRLHSPGSNHKIEADVADENNKTKRSRTGPAGRLVPRWSAGRRKRPSSTTVMPVPQCIMTPGVLDEARWSKICPKINFVFMTGYISNNKINHNEYYAERTAAAAKPTMRPSGVKCVIAIASMSALSGNASKERKKEGSLGMRSACVEP